MRRPLLCASLCLIILLALWHCNGASCEDAPAEGQCVTVAGYVYRKDEKSVLLELICSENSTSFYSNSVKEAVNLRQNTTTNLNWKNKYGRYLLCDVENAELFLLGSKVILQGNFDCFEAATNPGEFGYAAYYRSCGYAGRLCNVRVLAESTEYSAIGEALYRMRVFGERRLYQVFPEKEASVMSAILLGNKAGVNPEVKNLYRQNGMIHILSISGLHITLIGMGIYKLLRKFSVPMWVAALVSAIFLFLYGAMTGFGISVCRAVGMYLFCMLAVLLGRTYDMLTALGVVGAVLVWRNPACLGNMGFLLSFGSVLGIGVLFPVLKIWEEERRETGSFFVFRAFYRENAGPVKAVCKKLYRTIFEGLLAGFCVTWTTLPIQLWFSYEVPVYSVFLNVCVLPFMGIVLMTGILSLIPGLGWCGSAAVFILSCYEKLCMCFEKLPFHTWNPGRPAVWQMVAFYVLWIAVTWWGNAWHRRWKKLDGIRCEKRSGAQRKMEGVQRKTDGAQGQGGGIQEERDGLLKQMIWIGRLRFLFPLLTLLVLTVPKFYGDEITFLDVGQGDCICIRLSSGETYLFDCGSTNRSHVGEKVLIPYLKYHGIHRIDAVFLSHADKDHTSGILELIQESEKGNFAVERLILPDMEADELTLEFGEVLSAVKALNQESERKISVETIRAGDVWYCGKNKNCSYENYFLCLHPPDRDVQKKGNSNGNSECFWIQLGNKNCRISILLTGDTEGAGEKELLAELQKRELESVTVLKVAHHGSGHSTSDEFLEQVKPMLALISCGRKNVYGHPHEDLLERLRSQGSYILRTDQNGAVAIWADGKGVRVKSYIR